MSTVKNIIEYIWQALLLVMAAAVTSIIIAFAVLIWTKIARADVLLIVNGATVGPIANQRSYAKEANPKDIAECYSIHGRSPLVTSSDGRNFTPSVYCEQEYGRWTKEDNPATCERAMKEMGIRKAVAGQRPDGSWYPADMVWSSGIPGEPSLKTGEEYWRGPDGRQIASILCVPAPSGLRK